MKLLDKMVGPTYKQNLYFLFQVKGLRLFGYLFETTIFSSLVALIVSLICMLFTKNEGIINTIGLFVFVSLLLSGYKSSKANFLAFEKMLKNAILEDKEQK
jgi:hypothetical protein